MTNPLNQVNEAIIKDPHGKAARHASHWLAVEVMGWEPFTRIVLPSGEKIGVDHNDVHIFKANVSRRIEHLLPLVPWQPLTDPEHAHMLFVKRDSLIALDPPDAIDPIIALSILEDLHNEGALTNDTLKGWIDHAN
jgi:hypothetical protein